MSRYFYIIVLLVGPAVFSQTRDEVLKRATEVLHSKEPVEVAMEYRMYSNTHSKTPSERYIVVFCRAAGKFYYKLSGIELVMNGNAYLKVDHSRRRVVAGKDKSVKEEQTSHLPEIVLTYEVGYFKDKASYWEVEFIAPKKMKTNYTRVVFDIDKDFRILKTRFYYGNPVNISKDPRKPDYQKPVLEVEYGKYKPALPSDPRFSLSRFVTGTYNKYKLVSRYKNYELIYTN